MSFTRRSFLGAMLIAAAGPAIVRASSLMAVKPLADVATLELIEITGTGIPEATFTQLVAAAMQKHRSEMQRILYADNTLYRSMAQRHLIQAHAA